MQHFYNQDQLPEKEIIPGFHGRMVHTAELTMAYWRIEAGAVLPEHAHEHEQVVNLIEGEFEFTLDGETQICKTGGVVTIPPHVPHSGKALTDCYIIDVFRPVREDYKS